MTDKKSSTTDKETNDQARGKEQGPASTAEPVRVLPPPAAQPARRFGAADSEQPPRMGKPTVGNPLGTPLPDPPIGDKNLPPNTLSANDYHRPEATPDRPINPASLPEERIPESQK